MQISTWRQFQLCNLGWHLLYKHRFILACFPQHFGTQVFHGPRSYLGHVNLLSNHFTQHKSKTLSKTLYYCLGCRCIPGSVLGMTIQAQLQMPGAGNAGHTQVQVSLAEGAPTTPHQLYSMGFIQLSCFRLETWWMDGISFFPVLEHTHYVDSLFLSQASRLPPRIPPGIVTISVQFKGKSSASIWAKEMASTPILSNVPQQNQALPSSHIKTFWKRIRRNVVVRSHIKTELF